LPYLLISLSHWMDKKHKCFFSFPHPQHSEWHCLDSHYWPNAHRFSRLCCQEQQRWFEEPSASQSTRWLHYEAIPSWKFTPRRGKSAASKNTS
jgi:hypothetical protein